jgi:hypothetical protein
VGVVVTSGGMQGKGKDKGKIHMIMETEERVGVLLYLFLASALDGDGWSTLIPYSFTLRK